MAHDTFTTAYIEAMIFTYGSDDSDAGPWDASELAPEALATIVADCEAFQTSYAEQMARTGDDDERHGIDFWLTRNRHGAGFWDRGYQDGMGEELSDAAHAYGSQDVYRGDDGLIYVT